MLNHTISIFPPDTKRARHGRKCTCFGAGISVSLKNTIQRKIKVKSGVAPLEFKKIHVESLLYYLKVKIYQSYLIIFIYIFW